MQVGGAFQRQHGAVQRDHHAEEGAEHAEQHQQANQVGRDAGAGQGDAFAFDAQAHGVPQGGRHLLQPFAEVADVVRDVAQRRGQRRRVGVEAPHFQGAGDIDHGDDAGDGEGQRVAVEVADGDPNNGEQTEGEGE